MDLDNPGDPYANRMYTKEQTTGHGQSAVTMALHVGEYIAIRSGSAWVNQSELDAVAASMATRKARQHDGGDRRVAVCGDLAL